MTVAIEIVLHPKEMMDPQESIVKFSPHSRINKLSVSFPEHLKLPLRLHFTYKTWGIKPSLEGLLSRLVPSLSHQLPAV